MSKSYYAGGKRVSIEGVPCKVASWYGELGNDKEYLEAIKPRGFKGAYYEGGHRMVIGGVPVRVAAIVKSWRPWMKAALGKGVVSEKEAEQVSAQVKRLFPEQWAAKVAEKAARIAATEARFGKPLAIAA